MALAVEGALEGLDFGKSDAGQVDVGLEGVLAGGSGDGALGLEELYEFPGRSRSPWSPGRP